VKTIQKAWLVVIWAFIFWIIVLISRDAFSQVVPGGAPAAPSVPTSQITGNLQTATGGIVTNGTLNFTLSQPAIVSGTSSIAANTVSCYTSTAGSIVGVPDPLALPNTSVNLASGTLAAGTYFVELVYVGPGASKTIPSPEVQVVLSRQGTLNVNAPAIQPASATGFFAVYIGTTSGAETLQGMATSWTTFAQSTPLVAGSALPTTNNTTCNIWFSDTLIPTGTYYTVSLVNKNGSTIAGFPQTWCTFGGAGATINISNGAPTGNCGTNGVFYPTPLFAVPAGGSQQSISGPLILNGAVTFNSSTSFINSSISLTNAGIFTNAQTNLYDLVQVGGINNASFYASTFGGVHQTDAISGGIQIPAGATVTQADAIAGYCNALADSAGRTKANCGALFGLAGANANNSAVWGINTVIFDAPTATGHNMTGYENDIDLVGTPAFLKGFILTGLNLGGVVPATATGYEISTPFKLPIGFLCGRASCNVGAQFADQLSTNPSPSQSVQFIAHDGGAVAHISQINEDANGNEVVTDVSGGPNPITQRIGSGTATSAGTVINAGTSQTLAVTVTGATATDVAICATNAAYPATWQTGIQVLPPVVTSNTVTLTFSNPTAGNITPVAQTFRCTVTR
jgi:hypothetical protein